MTEFSGLFERLWIKRHIPGGDNGDPLIWNPRVSLIWITYKNAIKVRTSRSRQLNVYLVVRVNGECSAVSSIVVSWYGAKGALTWCRGGTLSREGEGQVDIIWWSPKLVLHVPFSWISFFELTSLHHHIFLLCVCYYWWSWSQSWVSACSHRCCLDC